MDSLFSPLYFFYVKSWSLTETSVHRDDISGRVIRLERKQHTATGNAMEKGKSNKYLQ